jgi:hypothetical protein
MKINRLILIIIIAAGFITPAWAGPNHDLKPKHGGIITESRDVTLELVVLGDKVNLYISDHGKALSMKELNGKLTVLNGSVKTEHNFSPAEQYLVATGIANLPKGSILVATVTSYQGKTLNARFVYK